VDDVNLGFAFIKRHEMDYRDIHIEELLDTYLREMQRGLDGEESSLLMLPSFVNTAGTVQRKKPLVAVDAGGTNLRIALIDFDISGKCRFLSDIKRMKMPGVGEKIEAEEFFDRLSAWLLPYMKEACGVSVSFAYPTEILPDLDGRIVRMVKEVSISGMEGQLLGRRLEDALEQKGARSSRVVVTNDAVASALAGMAEKPCAGYGSFLGVILGTGNNGCYIESNGNIGKLGGLSPEGSMMINTEGGGYALVPRTSLDMEFDQTTLDPGYHICEKMVSGAYIGPLCEFLLKKAAKEDVFGAYMHKLHNVTSADADKFLRDGEGKIAELCMKPKDVERAYAIVENTVLRAARFCAMQMAAMAVKAKKRGSSRVCITAEGSTYYKMYGLREEVLATLHPCLEKFDLSADVLEVENAVLKGCAIAGLLK
jgi:hexokinase